MKYNHTWQPGPVSVILALERTLGLRPRARSRARITDIALAAMYSMILYKLRLPAPDRARVRVLDSLYLHPPPVKSVFTELTTKKMLHVDLLM